MLRTRIAPTPSGNLHLGNAWSFVVTWLTARYLDAKIFLRVDDMDEKRSRPEYVRDIFEMLDWMGITWDEGPRNEEELGRLYSQRNYMDLYSRGLNSLVARSSAVYACRCSRREIAAWGEKTGVTELLYPGLCRDKDFPLHGPLCVWRLNVTGCAPIPIRDILTQDMTFDLKKQGDFVVRRKNGEPSYHFFSAMDDERFDLNIIVRGMDLLPSTSAQLFLADEAGFKNFREAQFLHHGLVVDSRGRKLSKYDGDLSLASLKQRLEVPEALFRLFSRWLGRGDYPANSLEALLEGFSPGLIPRHPLLGLDGLEL